MHDGAVLSACLESRAAYDRVCQYVDKHEFTPMAQYWWELVAGWYLRDDSATAVDRKLLRDRGKRQANEKHRDTMLSWFDDLPCDVSPDNAVFELLEVKRHAKGNELAAQMGAEPDKLLPVAEEYVDLLQATTLQKDTWIASEGDDDLAAELDDSAKITVLPQALNRRLRGGVTPGTHIVLFGPTEIGKSALAINMVAGFLRQERKVLYVSNEDAANKVRLRVRSNLAHMSADEIRADPDEARRRSAAKGFGNLFVGNMDPGDVRQIERKVEELGAEIVVIDQLRNLHAVGGAKGASGTQRIDQAAQEVRSLLIRKQLVGVSIMQAYAGEHGKPNIWFHASDVDSSRIGAPGTADVLLGMGADEEMQLQGLRAISICKNKVGGMHEGFICNIDTKRSKLK
jgi:hypothetical protein